MQLIPLLSLAATITAIFAQPVMLKVARDVPTKQAEANANDQSDPGLAVDRIALVGGGGVAGWMGYEILEKLFKGMRNKGAAKPLRSSKGGNEANVMRALKHRLSGVTFTRDEEDLINVCKNAAINYKNRRQLPINDQMIELHCKMLAYEEQLNQEKKRFPEDVLAAARSSKGNQENQENQGGEYHNGEGPRNFHSVLSGLQDKMQRIGAPLPKEASTSGQSSFVGLPKAPGMPKMIMVP